MKLPAKIRSHVRAALPWSLLIGIAALELTGCSGSVPVTNSEATGSTQRSLARSIAPRRTRLAFESFAFPAATPQPEIAPFFGNLSVVSAPAENGVLLQRQADCSLTYSNNTYTIDTTTLIQTINSQITHYETTIHNNAFLSTTPDQFPNGCVDTKQGITSSVFNYLGTGKNGQNLGAATDSADVYTAGQMSNGTITEPTPQVTDNPSFSIVSGDLNKDGNTDLVSINTDGIDSSVTVFLGKADGSYQAGVTYALPTSAAEFGVLDDLNGDGILDLIVNTGPSFSIFIGKGDGTFQPLQTFTPVNTTLSFASGFITADVNGDGVKDIVTTQGQVFLGVKGGGGVSYTLAPQAAFPPINTATNAYAPNLVAADFNKDGKLDLATNDGVTIRTYQGNGDGTFTTGPAYSTIANRGFLVATDLDGDGNIDLLSGLGGNGFYGGDDFTPNLEYALMGNGDGTFQGAPVLPISYTGTNLADLNGDGHLDLIGPSTTGNTLAFNTLLGRSNGTFNAGPQLVAPVNSGVDSYVVGDFNGDKIPDLLYLNTDPNTPGYYLALGNGDGSFQTPTFIAAPSFVGPGANDINEVLSGVVAADFNHDGKLDIVYSYSDQSSTTQTYLQGFAVQLGNGDGTFKAPVATTTYSSLTAPQIFFSNMISGVADVNKDNFPDVFLVLPNGIVNETAQHQVELFIGNGDGSFQAPSTLALTGNMLAPSSSSGTGFPIAFADLNGDGKMDLVAGGSSADGTTPELAIALGNGNGTFQAATILTFQGFGYVGSPAIADFTGDGTLDVFANVSVEGTSSGILPGNGDGTLQTISNGDGTVSAPQAIVLSVQGNAVAADLNKDGKPDLIVGNVVMLNETGVTVTPPNPVATTTAVVSSANPSVSGQSVTLAATVTPASGNTVPTGTVAFMDGGTSLGNFGLNGNGVAMLMTSSLNTTTHSITASYGGDSNFSGSASSPALSQVVNKASTSTGVVSSLNPSVSGQSVMLTATVSVTAPGAGTPTGTATFFDGATQVGSPATLSGGIAALNTSALTPGSHSITATYNGDANFVASTSTPALAQLVAGFGPVAAVPPVTAGQNGVINLTIYAAGGSFTMACTGLPAKSGCLFAPNPAVGSAGGTPVQLTWSTSSSAVPASPGGRNQWPWTLPGIAAVLAALITARIIGFPRAPRRRLAFGMGLAIVALAAALAGCASSNYNSGSTTYTGTPKGLNTFTVTATSGNTVLSTQVSVTVQ